MRRAGPRRAPILLTLLPEYSCGEGVRRLRDEARSRELGDFRHGNVPQSAAFLLF